MEDHKAIDNYKSESVIQLPKTTTEQPVLTKEDIALERISKWKSRQIKNLPEYLYTTKTIGNPEDKKIHIEAKFTDPNISELRMAETHRATLCAATGTSSEHFSRLIIEQAMDGIFKTKSYDNAFIANVTNEALLAMNPADEYEGMLCSRLLVLHNQYMMFMSRVAIPDQTTTAIDLNINRATKLMRVHSETLELLNRHRRKGEQKVTVQHVNVNSGGQVIVAGEMKGAGDKTKKSGV